MAIACSRLSDSESREDAKVKGTQKVGGAGRGVVPFFCLFFLLFFSRSRFLKFIERDYLGT